MTGNKKKSKLSPRSKFSASPGPPLPAVSTVHASGESSLPIGTSESNLHVHNDAPVADDSPIPLSSPAAASSPVQPQPSGTKQHGRNKNLSANDVERPTSRWFLRTTSTWPRGGSKKSAPVTSIAQENISGVSTSPTPSIRHEQTIVNTPEVIQEESQDSPAPTAVLPVMTKSAAPSMREASRAPSPQPELAETESIGAPEDAKDVEDGNNKDSGSNANLDGSAAAAAPAAGSYWFGWWYGPPPATEVSSAPKLEAPEVQAEETPVVEVVVTREPTPPPPPPPPPPPLPQEPEPEPIPTEMSEVSALDGAADIKVNQRPRSWFGFWGGGPESVVPSVEELGESLNPTTDLLPHEPSLPVSLVITQSETTSVAEAIAKQSDTQLLGAQTEPPSPMPSTTETVSSGTSVAPTKSSGWAFWSKDRSKPTDLQNDSSASSTTTVGQLAVANTPSASNPQKAKVKDIPATVSLSSPAPVNEPKFSRSVSNLREESRPITPKKADVNTSTAAAVPVTPQPAVSASSNTSKQTLKKAIPTNHVLPEFESCYHTMRQPSMFCQITRVFKAQIPHPKKHLYLTPTPPRIKKAVAIGVHGFFPMRLVRTVLGEPTGTSIRFANSAAAAIKRWAEKNNVEVEIEKIALEGEGKVGDRVEMLWKLLSNWMDHVRNADFVLMAAHSQGVVVGVQLLARLIEEGCVKEKARVGFTAMAGINLGPFYHLPTTILTGSAKELFEFQKPESTPSQKYMQALEVILKHNVRVLYVGSIDDQLVPLESSSFSNVTHPYIFRAVFVDGRVHAPDFLSHLVGFAMKLRNQGISDHGLIRELSNPLAGSLYGGEGHSRIYDDVQVYDLGVRHALETTDCEGVAMKVEPFELPTNTNNPFLLPWSMRGMLEESHVKDRLRGECMQLLEQFENWKPSSKVLKDVKFRLEGIRSKL